MDLRDFTLTEMPLASFDVVGDELGTGPDSKSFNVADWKITHSEKAIAKVFRIFERTPFVFNFVVVFKRANSIGSVMFDRASTAEALSKVVGKPIVTEGRITVVYNNHVTAMKNRMPLSAWTLAHRFGHAAHLNGDHRGNGEADHPVAKLWYKIDLDLRTMFQNSFKLLNLTSVGDSGRQHETSMGAAFCTFKAARDANLNSNWEVVADLFAQYLISGKISLNRLDSAAHLTVDVSKLSDTDYEKIDSYLDNAEKHLNQCMEGVLKSLVGTIVGF
jgi:hypothetical protein